MATMVMGSPSRLAQEVAALDSARTALKAGDAGQALTLLEAHARDFPLGRLGPEATLLRIEALLGSGDRVRAEQLARGFLATNPSSSHAAKVRRLLATLSLRDAAPFGAATSR
jgi:outer membrane protein assembly factor BamD (BamD/ComL family)